MRQLVKEHGLTVPSISYAADCADLYDKGFSTSGIYKIFADGERQRVYCDMSSDNGGWLVSISAHQKVYHCHIHRHIP